MKPRYSFVLLVLTFGLFLAAPAALSATIKGKPEAPTKSTAKDKAEDGKSVPTNITADSMVYDSAAKRVTFKNKVKVKRPDFTLTSDRLYLVLSGDGKAVGSSDGDGVASSVASINAGKIERIVAESHVRITLPEGRTATCDKATFTVKDSKLLMEGSPVLHEGGNQISGQRIVFDLKENLGEVQGDVKIDFQTKDLDIGR